MSIAKAGVSVLGGIESSGAKEQGFFVPQAEAIKKATGAIVVGVGGIADAGYADRIIPGGQG